MTSPAYWRLSKLFLESEGSFAVDTLTSASEALIHLKTKRYDAIISDYQMPEIDGIGFLKQTQGIGGYNTVHHLHRERAGRGGHRGPQQWCGFLSPERR